MKPFRIHRTDFTTEAQRALRACTEVAEALPVPLALMGGRGRRALRGATMPLPPITRRLPRRGGAMRRGPCRGIPLRSLSVLCASVVSYFLLDRVSL